MSQEIAVPSSVSSVLSKFAPAEIDVAAVPVSGRGVIPAMSVTQGQSIAVTPTHGLPLGVFAVKVDRNTFHNLGASVVGVPLDVRHKAMAKIKDRVIVSHDPESPLFKQVYEGVCDKLKNHQCGLEFLMLLEDNRVVTFFCGTPTLAQIARADETEQKLTLYGCLGRPVIMRTNFVNRRGRSWYEVLLGVTDTFHSDISEEGLSGVVEKFRDVSDYDSDATDDDGGHGGLID